MFVTIDNPKRRNRGHAALAMFCIVAICLGSVAQMGAEDKKSDIGQIKEKKIKKADLEHWSFRLPQPHDLPAVNQLDWVRNPIDRFTLARLEKEKLGPSPRASRLILIRRLHFDLTGLPPLLEDVDEFIADKSPMAYENLVDRLLRSSAYGQHWAQYWLDLARYAETDGYEHDKFRPNAWRYRDWVIDALNADMPYDQFVRWQIAGDELDKSLDARIATGFLFAGPDMPDINDQDERRHTKLNEITSTVGQVFLGLTIQCAQCHDHKYDPISQADFYRMRAIFQGAVPVLKRAKLMDTKVGRTRKKPDPSYLIIRGDFRRQGPELKPGFIRVINAGGKDGTGQLESETVGKLDGRRSELAKWLTRAKTPAGGLVARVIVNRIWQRYFGTGFVGTSGDLGFMGDLPTHPKLLDWLAVELIEQGWSLKRMHRLIVTSATYQQASQFTDTQTNAKDKLRWQRCMKEDPENKALWRMNRKRLTGEAIRDAILLVANKLDLTIGGPSVRPELPKEVLSTLLRPDHWKTSKLEGDRNRRSIYVFARRNLIYPMFTMFDRPDAQQCATRRSRSTTPTAALFMMNSMFSNRMAREFAGMLINENPNDELKRIEQAFGRSICRPPSSRERKAVLELLDKQSNRLRKSGRPTKDLAMPLGLKKQGKPIDPYRAAAWSDLCLILFNLNEFIYID